MIVTTSPPIILIIDDDAEIGRLLQRLAERAFPGFIVLWVEHGVVGIALARQHVGLLKLIVLDVKLDLMHGTLVAAQLRQVVPQVPIMPFTGDPDSLAVLASMGCVLPTVKQPEVIRNLPALMQQAMTTPVTCSAESVWITALRKSGDTVMAFVQQNQRRSLLLSDAECMSTIQRALALLNKYCRRVTTPPAREIQLARKALQEVISDPYPRA